MGNQKTDEIPFHSIYRQQEVQEQHIHGGSGDVVAYAGFLLPKPLGHGIGNGVAVQHWHQQRVETQGLSGL